MCSRLHIEREQFILKKSSQKDMAVGLKRKSPCCSCSGLASVICLLSASVICLQPLCRLGDKTDAK